MGDRLFPDAESAKYFAQQLVGGKSAGDRSECALGKAQFFRKQFELRQLAACLGKMFAGLGQRLQMAFAGNENIFGRMPAGKAQQLATQQFNALARFGRKEQ